MPLIACPRNHNRWNSLSKNEFLTVKSMCWSQRIRMGINFMLRKGIPENKSAAYVAPGTGWLNCWLRQRTTPYGNREQWPLPDLIFSIFCAQTKGFESLRI